MRIVDIIAGTAVDGPGLRTSIYFAGCAHRCPECHNPSTWDFSAGKEMSTAEIMEVIEENGFNVTFTGGDPLYQAAAIVPLAEEIRRRGYTIWCYTGFTLEQLRDNEEAPEGSARLLQLIDVLVDGPYIAALRDPGLRFRGSSNQRIIHLEDGKATKTE